MPQLGPFTIDHPFLLAPMAGITHSAYRRLMRRKRSAVVISELISATGIEYGGQRTLDLLKFHEEERRVGLQIFGEDVDHLCLASRYVEKAGADFVDLNLGCPVPKVVKKGAGAALCRNPAQLYTILSAMVKSVKIPVTIKIRTGWDADARNALDVVRAACDAGVPWVAIHGRTRAQGYSGAADWEFIGNIKAKVGSSIAIIGNGDVVTAEQAVERHRIFGVDAVMIGRGALRNPFIFEQAEALWLGHPAPTPGAEQYLGLLKQQQDILLETFSERLATIHSRKFLAWYSSGFPGASEFRKMVFSEPDPQVLWNNAFVFFKKNTQTQDLQFLNEPFLMGGHG